MLILATWIVSCGQKSANLQDDGVAPDMELYENGSRYLEKSQYIKARLAFQTLINTYPDSDYTPSAYLAIADSYYKEKGVEALLQAESQYKDFMIYFPTHEMADDAQLRIAAVNFMLMNDPDRDQTYTKKAAKELRKFISDFPDSEYAPTAREALRMVEENQARGVQGVANFYYKKESLPAAESRYKEVLEEFPDFSKTDETLYRLAETLLARDRAEEASVYYSQLAAAFPFSPYFADSKEKLELLEKDVPPVDEGEAERRQGILLREQAGEGSVLNPVGLIKGLFTGREDLYELARKRAEAGADAQLTRTSNNGSSKDGGNR